MVHEPIQISRLYPDTLGQLLLANAVLFHKPEYSFGYVEKEGLFGILNSIP